MSSVSERVGSSGGLVRLAQLAAIAVGVALLLRRGDTSLAS